MISELHMAHAEHPVDPLLGGMTFPVAQRAKQQCLPSLRVDLRSGACAQKPKGFARLSNCAGPSRVKIPLTSILVITD